MRKNLISASLIAGGLLLWLLSGFFLGEPESTDHATLAQQEAPGEPTGAARVRVRIMEAQQRKRFLVLRGRTRSKRSVEVRAEVAGKVIARPVERGMRVQRGDLLCQLSIDDREVSVAEAEAALKDVEIKYQGSLKLKEQGLQSDTAIAGAAARLEAGRAQLRRQKLNLERTRIVAPFAGVIEQLQLNVGDYATRGDGCATLIDLDPMLLTAAVTESEVENVKPGNQVTAYTSTGRELTGELTFIGKQSDPQTRTYPVEITIGNEDYSLRSGLTATARIELDIVPAHRISPALFTLNDLGEFGVRTIGNDNLVEFYPVTIIEDTSQGVWVTGLPATSHVIMVGQESVLAGQTVESVYVTPEHAEARQP